ncbi:hypothetical protein WMY93_029894 [Mugilogobius chulae]|uniref:Protein CDV3 homolog n=1 Tax=Mugilogobius chulae TaxID=88201 RepID=A0AAW0MN30_9GOBI
MADMPTEKSLDDFFAKRDKKKKKEKGKGKEPAAAPTTVVLKKTKKEKEKSAKNDNQDTQIEKEDEEWKEFEQKEVDYSGLRLQALQITDEKRKRNMRKRSGAPAPAAPVEDEEVPEAKPAGVYRPPGARLPTAKRSTNQGPPEIYSDTQFPSLLATAKHVETRKDREMEKTFEVVKHRTRGRDDAGGASIQHLQLDNQYAILGDK